VVRFEMSQTYQHPTDGQRTEDHALVARLVTGDRLALELLYERHGGWLTRRLQARCQDADTVDLAVQDTFVAVWRSASKFRGDGDVAAWIWGIGIRRLIDQLRKRRPTPIDMTAGHTPTQPVDHRTGESITLDAMPGTAMLALERLDPTLRDVMVATAIDGLTTREAASLLGIPHGTVKTRMMRARQQLGDALQGSQ
jgi:RNA polymerase sigma-70 factor, ECF subfamily